MTLGSKDQSSATELQRIHMKRRIRIKYTLDSVLNLGLSRISLLIFNVFKKILKTHFSQQFLAEFGVSLT